MPPRLRGQIIRPEITIPLAPRPLLPTGFRIRMKRLVWLLLAVFSTALAQVQPVTLPVMPEETCGCCDTKGGCDMPECALPAPAPTLAQLTPPAASAQVVARRAAQPARAATDKFFAPFVPASPRVAVSVVPAQPAPAAQVPLFVAHCSYLI